MEMRWSGYRRVRGQVCKRIRQRLRTLNLPGFADYRTFLLAHPEEWQALDALCRISISRFYRDQGVFQHVEQALIPKLEQRMLARGDPSLRIWSIGCASGEEPYTLALLCAFRRQPVPYRTEIVGTDADTCLLERARCGCYPRSSLREIPAAWYTAFEEKDDGFCIKPEYRAMVEFQEQDIRTKTAEGVFDLILCRNLAFTYFAPELQSAIEKRLAQTLVAGGYLLLGTHETLPEPLSVLAEESAWLYRRR